jgi:hypothetical protein
VFIAVLVHYEMEQFIALCVIQCTCLGLRYAGLVNGAFVQGEDMYSIKLKKI